MIRKFAKSKPGTGRFWGGGGRESVLGVLAMSGVAFAASPLDALIFYWMFLLLLLILVLSLMRPRQGQSRDENQQPENDDAALPMAIPEWRQSPGVRQVLDVKLATTQRGVEVYQGRLLRGPQEAFTFLRSYFEPLHKLPQLEAVDGGRVQLVVLPEPEAIRKAAKPKLWLHWGLFIATFFTMTLAGGMQQGFNIIDQPHRIGEALPYSAALLLILAFHEFGHYYTAKRYGMNVTPPFFIPVPFGGLGTFGAFIQLRSPSERRRNLFDVAVAGPLAGLVIAIPALFFGLMQSSMLAVPPSNPLFLGLGPLESPLLMDYLARLAMGDGYLPGGYLDLSPLARAGYLGLLLTMLNLLPIGQLDGGHISHAMFGSRAARIIGILTLITMFAVGILFPVPALVTWALIVFFIAGVRDVPPLDDITPIDGKRRVLGIFAFLILLSIATPSMTQRTAGGDRLAGPAGTLPRSGDTGAVGDPQLPAFHRSGHPSQTAPTYRFHIQSPQPAPAKPSEPDEMPGLGPDWT